ncbi:MAG: mannosyl-glycoprotein endo-beta-N-acetylglucosaminidase [Firmicutes bacterium]|nr:mannosyl-glycoprotein endo-beta-N-acetylglucosaminidase [Bacillota bacterium]
MLKHVACLSLVAALSLPGSCAAYQASISKPIPAPPVKFELSNRTVIDLSILGAPIATKEQCVTYLLAKNPLPYLSVSPQELVDIFYEEGMIEGIRPDVAFAQSLHETGFFRYGGDVLPSQNNYAGLGAIGNSKKGLWFPDARTGVRAQFQHLKAYASVFPPCTPIVDPRYGLVKNSAAFGKAKTWEALNGKWAVPGKTYGQMILAIHQRIIAINPD